MKTHDQSQLFESSTHQFVTFNDLFCDCMIESLDASAMHNVASRICYRAYARCSESRFRFLRRVSWLGGTDLL